MSTTTIETQVVLLYDDETTRTYTLPNTPDSLTAAEIENRINAINAGTATGAEHFRQTFVSNSGAAFVSIAGGKRITTTEDVIYNG